MTKQQKLDRARMFTKLMQIGISYADCASLRKISLTLKRWYKLECGTDNDHGTDIAIERGFMRDGEFVACPNREECKANGDTCKPYLRTSYFDEVDHKYVVKHTRTNDRETGALKRLAAIMEPFKRKAIPYIQSDPRGHVLWIVPRKELRKINATVKDIDRLYLNVGIAVY